MALFSKRMSLNVFVVGLAWGTLAFAGPYDSLEQIVGKAKSLSDFLSQPALVAAYKKELQEFYGSPKFHCETFEAVLANLRRLNEKVPGFGAELWRVQDAPSLTYYRAAEETSDSREKWELAEVPRKLHALWNDPSRKGCAGDDCSKAEVTAPVRWASALPGSRTFLLHRDGKFQGAGALLMPVAKGTQVFSLLTLTGSEAMQRPESFASKPAGRLSVGTFQDLFVDHLKESVSVAPTVAIEYNAKNPSIVRVVRLRPNRPVDKVAGHLDEFKPADPMAAQVASVVPRQCYARKDSKGLGLFAGGDEGGSKPSSGGSSPVDVGKLLVQIGSGEAAAAVAAVPPEQQPVVGQALSDLMTKDKDAATRQKAAMALGLLDKLTPAQGASEPSARAPASTATKSAPERAILGAFQSALKDSDGGVRALAAAALSDRGDSSAPVREALKDGLSGQAGTESGVPPIQIALVVAKAKNEPKGGVGPLTFGNIEELMDLAERETDAGVRGKILDQVATGYVKAKNPEAARDALQESLPKDPKLRQELLDKVNSMDCGEPDTGAKKEKA